MEEKTAFLQDFLFYAVLCASCWLALRYAAVWLLPFLIAWAVAAGCEPLVRRCCKAMRLKRSFVAAVVTLALNIGFAAAVYFLASRLWREAVRLSAQLSDALPQVEALTRHLYDRLDGYCSACPPAMRQWMGQTLETVAQQLGSGGAHLGQAVARAVTAAAASLPGAALFWGTTFLAVFFTIAAYPQLTGWAKRRIPTAWRFMLGRLGQSLKQSVGKWCKAQGILLAVTFGELLAGLWLLGQPYALLLALVIAVVDALPVLGAGMILLPWAVVRFAVGDVAGGLGLTALYAVLTVVYSVLAPKVMARQAQAPPLAALAALYVGFRVMGVGGMLVFPLLLLFWRQLSAAGILAEIKGFLRGRTVVQSDKME